MVRRLLVGLAAAALAAPVAVAPAQTGRAPAQRDWTRIVVQTPEGGFRMGNPGARVKVVEYVSLACPHCAAFSLESSAALIGNHVRTGRVSIEHRNMILNGADVTATLLARCAGTGGYFRMAEHFLATQPQWLGAINATTAAQRTEIEGLPAGERLVRLAQIGGMTAAAARYGVPAQQARRCLTDEAGLTRLAQMAQAANALGVRGTPTFLINGVMADVNSWSAIEPLIRQAGG